MSCPILQSLTEAVTAVTGLPIPTGLGADHELAGQVEAVAAAVAALQRDLATRMAAWEREGPPVTDTRGTATRAGLPVSQAGQLRRLGMFAHQHPALARAWEAGTITSDQAAILQQGARRLSTPVLTEQLVAAVLPHLPCLDLKQARALVSSTIDLLEPGDPDLIDRDDYTHRSLTWSTFRGGMSFTGYLPQVEAGAFTAAIDALVTSMRIEGDGRTMAQRRADALAQLTATATTHGLPTGGGLPATLTLTISLTEAHRIAATDPARHPLGRDPRPRGSSTIGGRPASDAAVRFGICCAAITPILTNQPAPTGLLGRIARTPIEPLAVGRAVRLATPAQRRALQLRDDGCVIPGCTITAPYTQPHHVTPYSLDGPTDLSNLASLCFVHHRQVELGQWELQPRQPGQPKPDHHALEHHAWWAIPHTR